MLKKVAGLASGTVPPLITSLVVSMHLSEILIDKRISPAKYVDYVDRLNMTLEDVESCDA